MNVLLEADRSASWRWRMLAILIGLGCLFAVAMYSTAGDERKKPSGDVTVVTARKDGIGPISQALGNPLALASTNAERATDMSRRALVADLAARFPDLHGIEIACTPDCTLTAKVTLPQGHSISSSPLPPEGKIEEIVLAHGLVPNGTIMVEEFAAEEWTVRLLLRAAF